MRWLLVLLLFLPSLALAEPFLVCDPFDASYQIQGFRGVVNGQSFDTQSYTTHPSGKIIVYDCSGLPTEQEWAFTNLRAYNVRGEGSGVDFFYPALPPTLTNLEVKP